MKNQLISFDDTETAFFSKSSADLNRAVYLFKMISYNWLVRMSPPFVNFAIWAHLPIKGIIKATIFRHFCGGESIDDCQRTIESLSKYPLNARKTGTKSSHFSGFRGRRRHSTDSAAESGFFRLFLHFRRPRLRGAGHPKSRWTGTACTTSCALWLCRC